MNFSYELRDSTIICLMKSRQVWKDQSNTASADECISVDKGEILYIVRRLHHRRSGKYPMICLGRLYCCRGGESDAVMRKIFIYLFKMLLSKHPRSPSNSSRSLDSINIWLDQHPAKPAEYISSDSQAPCPSPHLRKRRKLEEIDPPNSMSQYQTRSHQSSPEDKSGAPR